MPALPVIAGVYRVALGWVATVGPNPVNVLHFHDTTSTPSTVGARLDLGFDTLYGSNGFQCIKAGQNLNYLDITPLDGVSSTQRYTLTGAHNGDQTGNLVPEQSALVHLATGLRGPAHRGRIFWGPLTEDYVDNGKFNETARGNCQAGWVAAAATWSTQNVPLVVASYQLGTASLVTSITVGSNVGLQSRRLRRTRT